VNGFYFLSVGAITAFVLALLVYVRRLKDKMRRSVLRFERIKNRLES
jgi:hypothetical protein